MSGKPFEPGTKVIVVDPMRWDDMKKGDVFTVIDSIYYSCGCGSVNIGKEGGLNCNAHGSRKYGFRGRNSKCFARYNPYSSSVSKELAEKAMKPVIEIDQPVKELQTN